MSRREFWERIYDLTATGTTVVLTTHYMDEAERCHLIAFIFAGSLLDISTPQEIVLRTGLRVAELDLEQAHDAAAVLRSSSSVEDVAHFGDWLRIATRNQLDPVDVAKRILAPEGLVVRNAREVRATVEDAFVAMVRAQP